MPTGIEVIRRAVKLSGRGFATADEGSTALEATGGSLLSLEDTDDLPPAGVSINRFSEHWLWRHDAAATGDRIRRIGGGGYLPIERELTHQGPDYSTDVVVTDEYLIVRDDPHDWIAAWNLALTRKLFQLVMVEWSPEDNTRRQFTVTGTPISEARLTKRSQIREIEYHDENETAKELQWRPFWRPGHAFVVFEDEGSLFIDFHKGQPPQDDQEMRLVCTFPFVVPATLTTNLDIDTEYAVYGLLKQMADLNRDQNNPEDEWNEVLRKHRVTRKLNRMQRQLLGKYAGRSTSRDQELVPVAAARRRPGR